MQTRIDNSYIYKRKRNKVIYDLLSLQDNKIKKQKKSDFYVRLILYSIVLKRDKVVNKVYKF